MQLDLEDINFLEDLAEELRRHKGVYDPEAEELENIVLRAKKEQEAEEEYLALIQQDIENVRGN